MKAVLCKTFDGPQSLDVADLPDPEPGPGEVLMRVRAVAVNFFDTLIIRNLYQYKPDLPFSPCGEFAGVVEKTGPGVAGFVAGDRALAYTGWGACREKIAVPADALVAIPDDVSDPVAAGLSVTYGTAIHALDDRAGLGPGQTVAVLGASGGAGLAAIEIAKRLGARVIAVASSPEKLALCGSHGADDLLDYRASDLKKTLKAMTDGKGVDVVYDCVGGAASEAALRATAWGGRLLVIGFAGGEVAKIPLNLVLLKGCAIVGVFWGEFIRRNPTAHRANTRKVLEWCRSGELRPHIERTFGLEEAGAAIAMVERREARGKIVVTL